MPNSQADNYIRGGAGSPFFLFRYNHGSRAMILLAVLLLQIGLQPLDQHFPVLSLIMQLGVIVSAIFMVSDSRGHLILGLGFGIPPSFILVFTTKQDMGYLTWIAYGMILILYMHTIRLMLAQVFKAEKVTINTIALAMCIYVLLGFLWTLFYIPLAVLNPDAFIFNVMHDGMPMQDSLQYFSFVTLTTLGYGDIVPVAPLARSLAILEAITGVLFLAVLISRLVGSYNSDRRRLGRDGS